MSASNSNRHADRFSGAYNPKRRNLLTETNKENIVNPINHHHTDIIQGRKSEEPRRYGNFTR